MFVRHDETKQWDECILKHAHRSLLRIDFVVLENRLCASSYELEVDGAGGRRKSTFTCIDLSINNTVNFSSGAKFSDHHYVENVKFSKKISLSTMQAFKTSKHAGK